MSDPRPPFPATPAELIDRGIAISHRTDLGLASVLVRKGLTAALTCRIREHLALELPKDARRASAGPVAFAGIGPGAWLASCESGHRTFATSLAQTTIGDLAAVADQSDGYAVLRLSGARTATVLSRFVPVDLDAQTFQADGVATTAAGHMRILLWRLSETNGSPPSFELAVERSFAGSLWNLLLTCAENA